MIKASMYDMHVYPKLLFDLQHFSSCQNFQRAFLPPNRESWVAILWMSHQYMPFYFDGTIYFGLLSFNSHIYTCEIQLIASGHSNRICIEKECKIFQLSMNLGKFSTLSILLVWWQSLVIGFFESSFTPALTEKRRFFARTVCIHNLALFLQGQKWHE